MNIEIKNGDCFIVGEVPSTILSEIDDSLSYQMPGFAFRKNKRWDGIYRLFNKDSKKFSIGFLDRVLKILDSHNLLYSITDLRDIIKKRRGIRLPLGSKYKTRDYQTRAIKSCLKHKSGIVRMCTGSGKSFVIASVVAKLNVTTIIYVVSVDLLYQMVETLKDSYNIDAGMVGDGHCDVKKVTVMTIWSAGSAFNKKIKSDHRSKKKDSSKSLKKDTIKKSVLNAELMILDEGQYAGASTFQFIAANSPKARYRYLFSGTPWREQGDDILLEAVAGKKIVDVRATELIEKGFLVKPYITYKKIPVIRNAGKTYHEVYKSYIIENDFRNNYIISSALKMASNGMMVLVLFKNITHGTHLFEEIAAYNSKTIFLDGGKSSKIRNNAISDINNGKIEIVVASTIFDIGVDIPSASCLILAQSGKSKGRYLQRVGRVIRASKMKKYALVLDFVDQCKYLRDHSESRISACKEERAFAVKIID